MSRRIRVDANYRSYAEFRAALDEYCRVNAVGGVPLTFIRHTSKKLKVNTFKDIPLDQDTVNRMVYNNLTLKCIHHESVTTNENGPCCTGRITLLYNRPSDVLKVTTCDGHLNHPTNKSKPDENANESSHLNKILKIARQLPDEALALLEQVCIGIQANWGDENTAGVTVNIVPIESESQVIRQIKCESQQVESGALDEPQCHQDDEPNLVHQIKRENVTEVEDENDVESLPAVDVKVEAMSAGAIDDECYVVDNQVDLGIGGTVAKQENNDNEPNVQGVQNDGAGHGEIFSADPRTMVVVEIGSFNGAENDDKNEKKMPANATAPRKKERFRKLRLRQIDNPSTWKHQSPLKKFKSSQNSNVVKPEPILKPIVQQNIVPPAKQKQKRKENHKSHSTAGRLNQLDQFFVRRILSSNGEDVFEDFEESPPKKLKREKQS